MNEYITCGPGPHFLLKDSVQSINKFMYNGSVVFDPKKIGGRNHVNVAFQLLATWNIYHYLADKSLIPKKLACVKIDKLYARLPLFPNVEYTIIVNIINQKSNFIKIHVEFRDLNEKILSEFICISMPIKTLTK